MSNIEPSKQRPASFLDKDCVILHIGPHKTGTSAIQGALATARGELAQYGAHYPGSTGTHNPEVRSVLGINPVNGKRRASASAWPDLVDEVSSLRPGRVVVSAENFCKATPEQVAKVIDDLGGDRIHILVSLRPVGSVLSSAYQQDIKERNPRTYEDWLRGRFDRETGIRKPGYFWHRHLQHELIKRWADVVGIEAVTGIIGDPKNHRLLLEHVEYLLELPDGMLQQPSHRTNRSLSAEEAELVRLLNVEFDNQNWGHEAYGRLMRRGGIAKMRLNRSVGQHEHKIITPEWAMRAAHETELEIVEGLRALNVRLMGDVELLAPPLPSHMPAKVFTPEVIPLDAAVKLALGVMGVREGEEEPANSAKPKVRSEPARGPVGWLQRLPGFSRDR